MTNEEILEPYKEFKYIYKHYPESYFILNTRVRERWIKSRLNHGKGDFAQRFQNALNLDRGELIKYWKKEWNEHHKNVKNFFKNSEKFLVFDTEKDNGKTLCQFLKSDFPNLDESHWTQKNKTSNQ